MKFFVKLLVFGLLLISPNTILTAQNTKGLIVVESDGFGKKEQIAIDDAQYKALEVVLFKGVVGTDLNTPLIDNEREAKQKFGEYFEELKAGRFKSFTTNTNIISAFVKKTKGKKNISVQTEINYKALRQDLEQNQIIRKFGY